MQTETTARSPYRADFEALLERVQDPAWLRAARERAFARFEELGFPTTRHEAWKYTDLRPVANRKLVLAPPIDGDVALPPSAARGPRAVLLNGRFRADLSTLQEVPSGARVRSLREALEADEPALEGHLRAELGDRALAAFHAALFEDGVWIHVEPGASAEVVVRMHAESREELALVTPRLLVTVGANARLRVQVESTGRGRCFTNALTQAHVGANAALELLLREQDAPEAFHHHFVATQQERDSRLAIHSVTLGARLARVEYLNVLAEPGSDASLFGLYVPRGKQHMDHHVALDHAVGHTTSSQLFKGVLEDEGRGVFTGCVLVRAGADGTNARQVNRNLLLSESAKAETRPQLEIYADDVKCSHGAAIGQLDENQLFYARARGIDRDSARAILTYAFANEVLEAWPDEATRVELEALLAERWGSTISP